MNNHKDVNGRSGDLPKTSTPNSSQDLYVDGELYQRRFYDGDGNMIKDIDFTHGGLPGIHQFPHEHYWDWTDGDPSRSK